ncbi:DNA processing protein DprA [Paenibacillus darwinianus]|uniref:DNA processing protein DprA n=1 Tax=Paenibacillus darwinianus TaxID=1380763 RepID=A0A9W5S2E3_9BACL|nr:DNA-processing protein DprA [Paenibacillus darwinianus]EXX91373.1 DNA processing protein DprA [Paenibacillus darwinianus]EXX92279.1 DNA processing protein DprA [Paenibacillus darwinianus]EXX92851.1 DNA processing protein DprA [Paenibacillus darwinianus]
MEKWSKRDILFALHETRGVGAITIRKLVEGDLLEQCMSFGQQEWRALQVDRPAREALQHTFDPIRVDARKSLYAEHGISWFTIFDRDYPSWLNQISDPPWVLYAKGRLDLFEGVSAAVVGTRGPTAYGRHAAARVAEQLSANGITIVSGMARGIDTIAHEGGLRGVGSTVAVLGTDIETVYPPQNGYLYRMIAERGLLVSEYPLGTVSHPGLFPQRNRIIAGLSYATIVVEGAYQSGSLITAHLAQDYNREVYAVPGPINSSKSDGPNRLIRDEGAKLLLTVEGLMTDFRSSYGRRFLSGEGGASVDRTPPQRDEELSGEEALVVAELRDRPLTVDELATRLPMPLGHLHAHLINLSIKRRIEGHPGSLYSAL